MMKSITNLGHSSEAIPRQFVAQLAATIMADFVSEKKISEFQNAFFFFAHKATGVLKAKQMGEVMR